MAAKAGAALVTLFDWRWPIKCHLISNSVVSAIFCRASWTLFSPKSRWPAAYAARTWPALKVFDTARSLTSSGPRPAAAAAAAIRWRTAARLLAISFTPGNYLIVATMLFAMSTYWPVGESFRYVSKCGLASVSASFVPALTSDIPSQ